MYKKILLKTQFVQHTSIQDVSKETNEHKLEKTCRNGKEESYNKRCRGNEN